ncbi:unnamed protein product [Adineta ricciae]|uniref:Uncharacterized protein n=1 Tax=Adineta ricciae TaxID=249248 RepID=A0A813SXI0_ADIRI|nr:unnamed protein product [Adineta ricciae]
MVKRYTILASHHLNDHFVNFEFYATESNRRLWLERIQRLSANDHLCISHSARWSAKRLLYKYTHTHINIVPLVPLRSV